SYSQGNTANITGSNWDNSVNVTINITDPLGDTIYGPLNLTSNGTGYVNDSWFVNYNATIGDYNLYAIQPSNPAKNNSFVFTVVTRPVTVDIDYAWYKRNDTINITANSFSLLEDITVDIYNISDISVLTYPKNVTSNNSGGIINNWTIPITQEFGNYTINISDYVYPNLQNSTKFIIVIQNATTDSITYSSGDNVYISGNYWDRLTNVTIDIANSSGDSTSGYPKNVSVLSDGTFSHTWIAQPGAGFGAEQYNISVLQSTDFSENDTISIGVTKVATLNTNKDYYLHNQNVSITGSFYAQSDDVEIAIWSVNDSGYAQGYPLIIQSDASGDITHEWNTTDFCPGDYEVESEDQTYPLQLNANKTFKISYDNPTDRTCTDVWGADCSLWPDSAEGDNTFDGCDSSTGGAGDEHVDGGTVNATIANPGDNVSITCNFDPYASGGTELYIHYYDTTGWTNLYTFADTDGSTESITRSVIVPSNIGTHWFRCIADWDGTGATCEGGSYFDHDDISFDVVNVPSSCNEFDVTPPNVTQINPLEDTQYNLTNNILITANVVDNTAVDYVKAIINLTNGSNYELVMADDDSNDIFNCTFSYTGIIGQYNITIWANDTWDNINSTETTYFDINDVIYPVWNNNNTFPISPVSYSPSQDYQFNVSWTDDYELDTVWIEHNFTGSLHNYSITGNLSSVYYYDYSDISAGKYVWKMYANDSSGNTNFTDEFNYQVDIVISQLNLTLDSSSSNLTAEVYSIVNITGESIIPIGANMELYENGNLIN
ncbi:MAG: hypothetical protein KAH32_06710, partial [Chlamydiia bacterium]|nr:hypothetical protein [Chlamydiia bacterium]